MEIRMPLAVGVSLAVHTWAFQQNFFERLPEIQLKQFPVSMELSLVTLRPSSPLSAPLPMNEKTSKPIGKPRAQLSEFRSAEIPSVTTPVEQGVREAKPLPGQPPPAYPLAAQYRHLEGTTLLSVEVLADGRCGQVQVKKSSGSQLLDNAAVDGVKRWRFQPGERHGRPAAMTVEVPVVFRLRSSDK